MKDHQDKANAQPALLRAVGGVNTLETNSLCCAAAGIIAPSSATAEALIPHEKLRRAALADATLNAQARPLAQPVKGYTHLPLLSPTAQEQAVISAPCVLASSLRKAMENGAVSGKRCALTIADTLLQESHHGIRWYHSLGTPYVIVDICLRMLKPAELYKAQGFPADYHITHGADGKPFTVTQQVHMCGNSVSPPPMTALARANDPWEITLQQREAA